MTDERKALEEAWDDFAQTDMQFRRWACSIIDERGTTQAGRFAAMLDCGAYLDAAMMLVPEHHAVDLTMWGPLWEGRHRARLLPLHQDGDRWLHRGSDPHYCVNAATPALALLGAIREARKNDPHGTA